MSDAGRRPITQNPRTTRRYDGPKLEGERTVLLRGHEGFPQALMEIPTPPKRLYVVGEVNALEEGLAIIGARKATPYGIACAKLFSSIAADRGIVVISGGALGCDSAAHRATIESGGRSVAFLGGGCDELYPASNYELFQSIIDSGGAVVSEQSWDYPPLKHTFRARNRLIAGLARATLIVEAGLPSGTFTTADEALAANRDVLVVPGAISSKSSQGANRLIYQGATPIVDEHCFEDVLYSLYGCFSLKSESFSYQNEDEKDPLLSALKAESLRMDEMLRIFSDDTLSEKEQRELLMMHLVELQKQGKIAKYPDGRYGTACI